MIGCHSVLNFFKPTNVLIQLIFFVNSIQSLHLTQNALLNGFYHE